MKLHYFDQDVADEDDIKLKMAKYQGYVPETCLISGLLVFDEIEHGRDPCTGCNGPREKCHGRD